MDDVHYLESLGKAQTANVKRDAEIGVAEAERDAGIAVSLPPHGNSLVMVPLCVHLLLSFLLHSLELVKAFGIACLASV